ncbi:hypothetical protein L5515_012469 [Caenorhabditis briggsae]|uniref:Cell cycle control protein 50A n=1 Tax=Caenorhabditis briggsae TaxID=6238 RepID=A0AAE9ESP3_CAEBR|nr:hypothetical protein L5515_012469 [Caenorhabditis briggsae]
MPDDIPKLPRQRGKKNQPKDTAWKQQNLPALRPHYDVTSAIPVTLITGVATLAMGIALYFGHNGSLEQEVVYTNCSLANGTQIERIMRTELRNETFQCSYSITLEQDFTGDVKFYYGLNKFYQNNRLYFNSRNDQQLRGKINEIDGCDPLQYVEDKNGTKIPIAPCGYVANSMFNDTFQLFYMNGTTNGTTRVPWTTRGVLGATEMKRKFRNPVRAQNQTLCDVFQGTIQPPDWRQPICQLGVNSTDPDVGLGFENIDFMVWMKVAALPNFRKLYRILNRQVDMFSNGLPKGTYQLVINYNYPVYMYDGDKSFIITSENWVGPRNLFLPVIYLVVGTFLLLVTILFILIWLKQRLSRVHPT